MWKIGTEIALKLTYSKIHLIYCIIAKLATIATSFMKTNSGCFAGALPASGPPGRFKSRPASPPPATRLLPGPEKTTGIARREHWAAPGIKRTDASRRRSTKLRAIARVLRNFAGNSSAIARVLRRTGRELRGAANTMRP